jgi:ribonuclease BN (tRNA processing enzyme)
MAIKEHLTPEQCAALAARAQPKHVVLTHFYPPVERLDIVATMRTQYSGYVTLARDGWRIELDDSLTPNT